MCGIVGIFNLNGDPVPIEYLQRMTGAIAHRGPDGEGHFTDGPVGLGNRRLAIIDLTPAGQQPMSNETGQVVITYNGEIYNFPELKLELQAKGHRFVSKTDTEVVIHAYEEWGVECVNRFNGMFAFAIWDCSEKQLFLARDRYGIKPLYYFLRNGVFLFASEIKALLEHPAMSAEICYPALNEYFTFQNIFSDLTLFKGVFKLPPGSFLILDSDTTNEPKIQQYWDFDFSYENNAISERECAEELYRRFVDAVTRQLISDVPVGSYLSGGMDSGSIVAVAAKNLGRLMTFTCGFDLSSATGLEAGFDERARSEVLSNHFKTEHYEVVLHAGEMERVMPELTWCLDEPRMGQSYPNFYAARLAGKFVKVVLSGGGGDELFAGYPWRYFRGIESVGQENYFKDYYSYWQRMVPEKDKPILFREDVYSQIQDHSTFDVFKGIFKDWDLPITTPAESVRASLYFELKTFLRGLLVIEDKISMAHSLETRVPFLDNDLVDFALQIPVTYKLRRLEEDFQLDENIPGKRIRYLSQPNRDGKAILREAMSRLIPLEVINRPKQGFSGPDASWFRGESIDYVNSILANPNANIYEFLNPKYVGRILDQHSDGIVNHRLLIWSFLSFEWWLGSFLRS